MKKITLPAWVVIPKDEKPTVKNTEIYASRSEARKFKDDNEKIVKAKVVIE
jgi:hypothetical protein